MGRRRKVKFLATFDKDFRKDYMLIEYTRKMPQKKVTDKKKKLKEPDRSAIKRGS
jgi:hypothetical protein